MTKYEGLLELMQRKNIARTLKVAKQGVPEFPEITPDAQKEIDKFCMANVLRNESARNPELNQALRAAANELVIDKLYIDLDIKKDPNFKMTPAEELAIKIAQIQAQNQYGNLEL